MESLIISAANIEIILFTVACTVMLSALFLPSDKIIYLHWFSVGALIVAAFISLSGVHDDSTLALNGLFLSSPLNSLLKAGALLSVAACLAFSTESLKKNDLLNGDFLTLILFSSLGMSVLISAAHFLILYLGLEIMSLTLYALIAIKRNSAAASEAALKYFVLGALASGLFLYGISMIYGATGNLSIIDIQTASDALPKDSQLRYILIIGMVFMIAGIAFKLGVVPFHMWLPDVYHASPTPITIFIASAPKIAVLSLLLSVLPFSLPSLFSDWQTMLTILAIASLALGNITAIAQTSLKRMLAYSAIAHSGFLVLGVASNDIMASSFYVSAYALMTIGAFGAVLYIGEKDPNQGPHISDMAGLASRNIWMASAVTILMLSMAGIPPTIGFIAKLLVLKAIIAEGNNIVAVIAVMLSVVGAFYYLRIIRFMFFEKTEETAITLKMSQLILLSLFGLLTLWFGIFPDTILKLFEFASARAI